MRLYLHEAECDEDVRVLRGVVGRLKIRLLGIVPTLLIRIDIAETVPAAPVFRLQLSGIPIRLLGLSILASIARRVPCIERIFKTLFDNFRRKRYGSSSAGIRAPGCATRSRRRPASGRATPFRLRVPRPEDTCSASEV